MGEVFKPALFDAKAVVEIHPLHRVVQGKLFEYAVFEKGMVGGKVSVAGRAGPEIARRHLHVGRKAVSCRFAENDLL